MKLAETTFSLQVGHHDNDAFRDPANESRSGRQTDIKLFLQALQIGLSWLLIIAL